MGQHGSGPFVRRARLVVELDGGQHLESLEAYRRDRRKDALLQERGYFVLRFLAEDVGARLDLVLDAILRAWRTAERLRAKVEFRTDRHTWLNAGWSCAMALSVCCCPLYVHAPDHSCPPHFHTARPTFV